MKKFFLIFFLLLAVPLMFADWTQSLALLDIAEDVNAGATATNGAEFTSNEVKLRAGEKRCLITVTFTRAAGTASTVDYAFQVSYDDGTTWSDFEFADIKIATNHAVISGNIVRVSMIYNVQGISHIRLKTIINNDGANNVTACNVTISQ